MQRNIVDVLVGATSKLRRQGVCAKKVVRTVMLRSTPSRTRDAAAFCVRLGLETVPGLIPPRLRRLQPVPARAAGSGHEALLRWPNAWRRLSRGYTTRTRDLFVARAFERCSNSFALVPAKNRVVCGNRSDRRQQGSSTVDRQPRA